MSIRKINPSMFLIVIWTLLFVAPILAENRVPDTKPNHITKWLIVKQGEKEWRTTNYEILPTLYKESFKFKYVETPSDLRKEFRTVRLFGSFSVEELEVNSWNP